MKLFKSTQYLLKLNVSKAFTLAEVLITLGIIGVVAIMTIPSLIQRIDDNKYKNMAREAYSKLSQVITHLNNDSNFDLSSYSPNNQLKPALMNYLKIVKDCGQIDCARTTADAWPYKTLAGETMPMTQDGAFRFDDGQFITADGMLYMIENWSGTPPNMIISIDVNGSENAPNILGRDVFSFQIIGNSLLPMGAPSTSYPASTYCNRKGTGEGLQGIGCMSYVMQNIDY